MDVSDHARTTADHIRNVRLSDLEHQMLQFDKPSQSQSLNSGVGFCTVNRSMIPVRGCWVLIFLRVVDLVNFYLPRIQTSLGGIEAERLVLFDCPIHTGETGYEV